MPRKPKRSQKSAFSVAMSQETGCIVMVRTLGDRATIIGSLTREDSLAFADSVIDWELDVPAPLDAMEAGAKSIDEAIHAEIKPRVYPH